VGDYDLVVLGAGSSDRYAQQVGNQLGALLGLPTLNCVNSLTVTANGCVSSAPSRMPSNWSN